MGTIGIQPARAHQGTNAILPRQPLQYLARMLGRGIGKRARRRRVFNVTLSLLLALLMVVSPQELYALQVQARINQAAAAAALADTPTPTTIEYTYDDNGNLKTRRVNGALQATYDYDFDNRLIQATVDAQTSTYTYDTDGLRRRGQSPFGR
jgi:YD repeat-containing protein